MVQTQADASRYAKCVVVTGDLRITKSLLGNLADFARLKRVTGTLVIENNPALRNVDALSRLEEVGALEIVNNTRLVSLKGLDHLRRAKSVRVFGNRVVYGRLGLFNALEEVEGLEIHQSAGLTAADVSNLRARVNQQPRAARAVLPRG